MAGNSVFEAEDTGLNSGKTSTSPLKSRNTDSEVEEAHKIKEMKKDEKERNEKEDSNDRKSQDDQVNYQVQSAREEPRSHSGNL